MIELTDIYLMTYHDTDIIYTLYTVSLTMVTDIAERIGAGVVCVVPFPDYVPRRLPAPATVGDGETSRIRILSRIVDRRLDG
jgi:hypothetical protein